MAEGWTAGWARRVTTGRVGRLVGALVVAPLGGAMAGLLFDVIVVLLLERDTLHDINRYHGAKPIWFAVLAVVSAPAIILGLLIAHLVFATLRLRALWPYLAAATLAGAAFTWNLNESWVSCPPTMQGACPPPPPADQVTKIMLGNVAMGLAPAVGAALTFWTVLRPDRERRT
ncbi:hypothetical protein [Falsiroseomonas sp.]|uniref:hypothetical protein n=1 Tax=Falsiroseomonas sp. TaxID=2870721 RepID=UPI0035693B80